MKYCRRCGTKLNEDARFCNKCGTPTSIVLRENEEKAKIKNEENKEKLLLFLGAFLIIGASVIFAIVNWSDMTNVFKILFLAMEGLVFLSLSMLSKKLKYELPHKFLWFIGIIFVPIILYLLPYYNMIGDYFSKESGLYIYLAISTSIIILTFILSNKFIKSNLFLYVAYIFIYELIADILCIFTFDTFNYIVPVWNIFTLTMCIFYTNIKNEKYKTTICKFLRVSVIVLSMITCGYLDAYKININDIVLLITALSVIVSMMLLIFKSEKSVMIHFHPICIYTVIIFLSFSVFTSYENITLFLSVLGILFTYFILAFKESKSFNIVAYIFMCLGLFQSLVAFRNMSDLTLCIISTIILISYLFTLKINEKDSPQNYITKLLIPLNIYLITFSLLNTIIPTNDSIIFMISSAICFVVYIIFDKKNDEYSNYVFSIASYILLGISGIVIIGTHPIILLFIFNQLLWLTYFIYNTVIKNHKIVSIVLLIISILNFVILGYNYNIDIYYSLLFASLITLILDLAMLKQGKLNAPYIYISISACSLASLIGANDVVIIGSCMNVLMYCANYYVLNKKHKCHFLIKFIYTIIGFLLINSLFTHYITNFSFASLLVLAIYLTILICMYLLQVDDDRKIFAYTLLLALPYLNFVRSLNIDTKYIVSLELLFSVFIILIYFERVFKLKETDKIIFELILLGLAHLITIHITFVLDLFLAAFYLFYGFYKKRDAFVIFGIILLVISLLINISKIFNSLSITFALLIIGLGMLGCVFYIEAKKKKKDNK